MTTTLRTVLIGLCLVCLLPVTGQAEVQDNQEGVSFTDTGPLRIREQFILGTGFLNLEPDSGDVLDRGKWQVEVMQSITNNWTGSEEFEAVLERQDRRREPVTLEELTAVERSKGNGGLFFADGELYRTNLSVRYGLGAGYQLAVTVPYVDFRGGFGDDLIEEFHDTFGFDQGGRLGVPRDRYTIYFRNDEGHEVFRTDGPDADLGDVTVSLKKALVDGEHWKIAAQGVYKAATGEEGELFSSGSDDYGAQLLLTRYGANDCWHLILGGSRLGEHEVFALEEQTRFSAMLGYEHRLTRNSTWLVQAQVSESPFEEADIEGLDDLQYLVDLGVKVAFNPRTVAFIALTENVVEFTNSADVGLHFGLTWTP